MSESITPPEPSPVPPRIRSRRDPAATRRRWVERMPRFATSSLTVAEFCVAEGISVPAFYQWKRTLAATDTPPSLASAPTFIPLRVAPPNTSAVELVLPTGAVLRHLGDQPC